MYRIDINCDMGEGFGAYRLGADDQLMKHITSANIACGFHAGDPGTIRSTVRLALEHGVAIGAHPGLPDMSGFGRRRMDISPREAYEMVVYQVGAVMAFAKSEGGTLTHVKPHGALYNMAAQDASLAEAIAEAVYRVDGNLKLYGLSGSELVRAGERIGLFAVNEAFADRAYEEDGSLTPRSMDGAVLDSPEAASAQAILMVSEGKARTRSGTLVNVQADSICVHGDTHDALAHVTQLRKALKDANVTVQSPGK
ncbi:LamB/YcsF family protein [Paenibacillus soyae]|uniref:5-oxoprolinase subunit A n=1 Tax=Paenibacillus soyae TaxID=2969249 RepID=A0A9X2S8W0_9BACL|nr:5-oxoprolinase subunit PxpA [Paenibacillus soyae]MCR2804501.1 LamB/YcsF family protein [Paenibacillus soyae]